MWVIPFENVLRTASRPMTRCVRPELAKGGRLVRSAGLVAATGLFCLKIVYLSLAKSKPRPIICFYKRTSGVIVKKSDDFLRKCTNIWRNRLLIKLARGNDRLSEDLISFGETDAELEGGCRRSFSVQDFDRGSMTADPTVSNPRGSRHEQKSSQH